MHDSFSVLLHHSIQRILSVIRGKPMSRMQTAADHTVICGRPLLAQTGSRTSLITVDGCVIPEIAAGKMSRS